MILNINVLRDLTKYNIIKININTLTVIIPIKTTIKYNYFQPLYKNINDNIPYLSYDSDLHSQK